MKKVQNMIDLKGFKWRSPMREIMNVFDEKTHMWSERNVYKQFIWEGLYEKSNNQYTFKGKLV